MVSATEGVPVNQALDSAAGWRVVGAATFGLAFGPTAVFMLSFGVLVTVLHQEFGWEQARIALGSSIAAIALVFASPLQGWLVDRFGPRRVILFGTPAWAAFLFLLALMPASFTLFLVLCALFPFVAIGLWPLSYMTLPAGWFERRLGLAIGITNCGVGVGVILVPILLGIGIQHVGWRWSYAGIGLAVLFVAFPILFFFLKEGSALKSGPSMHSAGSGEGWAIVRLPRFQIIAASFFLLGLSGASLLVFLVPILVERGMPQAQAIFIQSVLGVGTLSGRVIAGWLLDRYTVRSVGIGIFMLAASGALTLAYAGPGALAPVAAILLGLMIGAEFDLLAVAIRRFFSIASFGRIYGLTFASVQFGGALGIGFLSLMKGQAMSYTLALWIFGFILIAAAMLFSRIGGRDQEARLGNDMRPS